LNAKAEGHWQVKAAQVAQWVDEGREDFLVVDVRPNPGEFEAGHIPGAIYMSYNEVLKPENLERLPKDKMIILSCVTGQTQNLPVLALRALGYDARTMSFGHSAWIKGYYGGKLMKGAIQGAEENEYPLVK
ncbi:MAG: rhodanese-like domain-containing protein, partial [Nitrospirota bacterium]